jgi:hypothetical protein
MGFGVLVSSNTATVTNSQEILLAIYQKVSETVTLPVSGSGFTTISVNVWLFSPGKAYI